jgi:VanZ family protein
MNRYKIAALLWTIITIGLSSIPSQAIPRTFLNEIFGIDKLAHITFYLIMVLLWLLGLKGLYTKLRLITIITIMCVSIGLIMEIYQKLYFVDRSFDWLDSIANTIGAILGSILFIKYEKLFPIFANPTIDKQ